jgi:hypothetical protein
LNSGLKKPYEPLAVSVDRLDPFLPTGFISLHGKSMPFHANLFAFRARGGGKAWRFQRKLVGNPEDFKMPSMASRWP